MKRSIDLLVLVLAAAPLGVGCDPTGRASSAFGQGSDDGGASEGADLAQKVGSPGQPPPPQNGCLSTGGDPNADQDGDGFTPKQGDCDDCNPSVNPGAIQIAGDKTDYACNGKPGVLPACDANVSGMRDPSSLAKAFDQCDPRFFKGATLVGPSDQRARKAVPAFGVVKTRSGQSMALLSSGIAADKQDPDFDAIAEEDPGTAFDDNNTIANPLPALPGVKGCSQKQPGQVNDYTELVVKLKAPSNANSFSFDFQFFSAEYPVFVCTEYNDEFLVLQESHSEFGGAITNIAFDMQKNPITVNNGFFTVCENDPSKPQTQHCKRPVSDISGTGFEDPPGGGLGGLLGGGGDIPGGSTGWLSTKSPVSPGEDVTLHFIIFDEGDHILDSAVLIDNFQWGAVPVMTPMTQPIG